MTGTVRMTGCYGNDHLDENIHLKIRISWLFYFYQLSELINALENVDWIFLKVADQSNLVKIVLIKLSYLSKIVLIVLMHNKCSQADIAHNSFNLSNNEQRTRRN